MEETKTRSTFFIRHLENLFKRWGSTVSSHPWKVIVFCIITTALCGLGFLKLRFEHRAEMLWIPKISQYNINSDWLDSHFKENKRHEQVLVNSGNILTPEGLNEMLLIDKAIKSITVNDKAFNDLCFRVPTADIFHSKKRKKRNTVMFVENTNDWDQGLKPELIVGQRKRHSSSEITTTATKRLIPTEAMTFKQSTLHTPKNNFTTDINETNSTYTEDRTGLSDDGSGDYVYDYESLWSDYNNEEGVVEHTNKTQSNEPINWADYDSYEGIDNLPPSIYCDLVDTLDEVCFQRSLLEIWKFDEARIMAASQQEIIDAINLLTTSPWYGFDTDFGSLLGGIERNSSGDIIAATTADMYWGLHIPDGVDLVQNRGGGFENQLADVTTLEWENIFVTTILNMSVEGFNIIPFAGRSFGDISAGAVFFDGFKMTAGYMLMFIFTIIMVGKINCVEVRLYLSVAGIVGVIMGLIISVGTSSLLGVPYTPMHTLLPFLLLGIGIDDMFVITQSWINLNNDDITRDLPFTQRVSLSLQHAGVAITVTSLTDVFAFGVGAISQMPGLVYFCISCAIGLTSIYLLSISWFVAWLALDERRISEGRNGLLPCLIHKEAPRRGIDVNKMLQRGVKRFSSLLQYNIAKLAVVITTIGLLGVGIWGSIHVKQRFDWLLMMPEDSYPRQWFKIHNREYLSDGGQFGNWREGFIYTGEIDHSRLQNIESLVNQLLEERDRGKYLADIDPWWTELKHYLRNKNNTTCWEHLENPEVFSKILSEFLFSPEGTKYQPNFRWEKELECNKPAPKITASKFSITYKNLDEYPKQHYLAKKTIEELVEQANISSTSFSYVHMMYLVWENEDIVSLEMWRNIGLAMLSVFLITFLLLANLPVCLMVLVCVILTLVDTMGFLFFWNIDIYFLSMVYIVIAVGLCVDYSVHIAHTFIISKGSREERAMLSLTSLGPAVLNGGITTFLAVFLLGFSTTHVFITFFKVFVLTVIFGLFHGLVFLPVILSLIGPQLQQSHFSETPTETSSSCSEVSSDNESNNMQLGVANLSFVAEKFPHTLEIKSKLFVEK